METHYTDEVNVQILVALMKHHGIRKVVASPGTTNITFVASLQCDPFFEVFSSADERSAAYIACGMAAESGEPVALSCTGATASRNYLPGLTEAFYRKLPVLAVTSSQHLGHVGRYTPQVIDRSAQLPDVCKASVQAQSVHDDEDRRGLELALNEALLELTHAGGGPVHVNLVTTYSGTFNVTELPKVQVVDRVLPGGQLPSLEGKRVAVFVGAHAPFNSKLTTALDAFCAANDAVVVCDHTSNYHGPYRILGANVACQSRYSAPCKNCDVLVYIGEVSGAYIGLRHKECWRVSPDGKLRDPFGKLRYAFEMDEAEFFEAYACDGTGEAKTAYVEEWEAEDAALREKIPQLPFSNIWLAQQTAHRLPEGSVLHLGILNSLRCWNRFEVPASVNGFCNTGGFGIDGDVSSLIGASLAAPDKLFIGVVGDLAMFYDLNSLGNRHVGSNLRLVVVNNGVGTEFKNYNHKAAAFGDDADAFMAARGHYGSQSPDLLRHYAGDLGFEYYGASNKEEYLQALERLVDPEPHDCPLLVEVFTNSQDESDALKLMNELEVDAAGVAKEAAKSAIKKVAGEKGVKAVKKMLGR